ncbi:hypothetical protein CAC42_5035 [Sphaceloma murrayae]|uniref:FAM192A/Fyv6 N-terminal domain-containing protein n=1 Tax=Sphaceloma murrayae TaxID=2082308 RepID=A0A2K1R0Z2_9PEZI|nr:hypothetical protein CAC42_5035 [Sphaceloma murrayae]
MSRFVSGGTVDTPTERSEEWLKAQQAIEAKKVEKLAQSRQEEGKSLYETLQANKAAKQDAFEESTRLRNQFRALDEDEIDFLESLNESTRAKDIAIRKETTEQLNAFREQQLKTEREARKPDPEVPEVLPGSWSVSKKRKREKSSAVPGIKLRKSSTGPVVKDEDHSPTRDAENCNPEQPAATTSPTNNDGPPEESSATSPQPSRTEPKPISGSLGLAAYSSDEDD